MTMLQVAVLVAACCCVYSMPQQAGTYGIPSQFLQDSSFFTNRYQQDYPRQQVRQQVTQSFVRPHQDEELELLPPVQHVVGTIYPAVDPGPGFRFPLAHLLNHTPPPNLKH